MASQMDSKQAPIYTLAEGRPYLDPAASVSINNKHGGGLILMQDTQLIETLAHFARERVPERVVHAKGAGAFGTFTVTHDITDISCAAFLSEVGKETDVMVRISTVGPESGSADSVRDPRGWAMKFFTEEGNQDWVFNNTPIFFVRDPIKFPSLNRSHKRHPQTHLKDSTMFWDFHNNNQEGTHELMHLFSDRGTPASLRHMDVFSGHTYKFAKADGSFSYVKLHFKTDQGIKNFTEEEATKICGENPDYNTQDLFEAIERKDFPTWTAYIQVMSPQEAENYRWNIFDMTKVWPFKDFPLRPFGKLELNRNPRNYFADVEQAAFSPSTMVPGIEPSADPMLQARMFSYPDAQRYRLGVNYQQLPINRAHSAVYSPYQRDGASMYLDNYGPDPNYVRSSIRPVVKPQAAWSGHDEWVGKVASFTSEVVDDDFVQARGMWKVFERTGQQENFVKNVAGHLGKAEKRVQSEAIEVFKRVDVKLGERIGDAIAAAK